MGMEFHTMIREDEEAMFTGEQIEYFNHHYCTMGRKDNLFSETTSKHHYKKLDGMKSLCGKQFHSDNTDERVLGNPGDYDYVNCPLCKTFMDTYTWTWRAHGERMRSIITRLNDWLEIKCKKHKWLNWLLS